MEEQPTMELALRTLREMQKPDEMTLPVHSRPL